MCSCSGRIGTASGKLRKMWVEEGRLTCSPQATTVAGLCGGLVERPRGIGREALTSGR